MEDTVPVDYDRLINLLPVIQSFINKKKDKEAIDLEETVKEVASALGIDDIAAFAQDEISKALSTQVDEENAEKLAATIVSIGVEVTPRVMEYVQKGSTSADLFRNLNKVYADYSEALAETIKNSYGIVLSPETQESIAQFSLDAVSVYCFMAAYKIYKKAADDASIAHEQRLIIEKRCQESADAYERCHMEMETLVDRYLGKRLRFFESGIEAMDSSILADDTDGYIAANAKLQESLGRSQQFHTQEEFDDLMFSDDVFKL